MGPLGRQTVVDGARRLLHDGIIREVRTPYDLDPEMAPFITVCHYRLLDNDIGDGEEVSGTPLDSSVHPACVNLLL